MTFAVVHSSSPLKENPMKSILRNACAAALAAGVAFSGPVAAAGTATSNLDVGATVAANCTISTTAVAFGAYDPIVANAAADLDNAGSVSVTCTSGASTKVTLGQGSNADALSSDAAPIRNMKSGANLLSYALYSDSGRATAWGNDAATGVSHTGTGTATSLSVYGRVVKAQNVPAGTYADIVVATVTF
jgi:spore coat protein U-like protein